MKITSIDHIQIAIPPGEEDTARSFYINVLGFTEIPKPTALVKNGGAWFQSDAVQLHVGIEKDFHPARKAHPAFIVTDLSAMLKKVEHAGFGIDHSQPPLDGYNRVHIFDPFGNRIELMERT
jgi:catechol 2,3-dioxygenase-like lactoylglutathione lyase family enzyme